MCFISNGLVDVQVNNKFIHATNQSINHNTYEKDKFQYMISEFSFFFPFLNREYLLTFNCAPHVTLDNNENVGRMNVYRLYDPYQLFFSSGENLFI